MRCGTERRVGKVTILDVAGQVMLGNVETEVTERIRGHLRDGQRAFLLNLDAVTSIDSHGLGDLVAAHEAASQEGATVKLLNVRPRVREPLRVMNLLKFFEMFESEAEAVTSFS